LGAGLQRLNGGFVQEAPVPQPVEHPVFWQHATETSNDVQVTPNVVATGVGVGVGATGVGVGATGVGVGAKGVGVGATGVGVGATGVGVGATGVGVGVGVEIVLVFHTPAILTGISEAVLHVPATLVYTAEASFHTPAILTYIGILILYYTYLIHTSPSAPPEGAEVDI